MPKARIPENEIDRLQALVNYNILDTPPEAKYDDITQMASILCGVPISLISLIDKDRQWFKSNQGVEISETPRDFAFCAHAILEPEFMEIADARVDERFRDNPFVLNDPPIIFYASSPLMTPSGFPIGTLCVADSKPGQLNATQRLGLQALSRLIVREFEFHKNLHEVSMNLQETKRLLSVVEEKNERLHYAERMKALGEMAGGIAHEINTPLALILNQSHYIRRKLANGSIDSTEIEKRLEKIEITTRAISDVAQGMLIFAHENQTIDIGNHQAIAILKNAVSLTRSAMSKAGIILTMECDSGLMVKSSLQLTTQIITNLLMNAIDAIQGQDEPWIKLGARRSKSDEMIEFFVIDSGKAIPEAIRSEIMKPFFTTKPAGKGTGLGLSISNDLAKRQNGSLELEVLGSNTTFILSLPF